MKYLVFVAVFGAAQTLLTSSLAEPSPEDAPAILRKVLESDPWGLSGAAVSAHAGMVDKHGADSSLGFSAKSKRLAPGLSESVVRFSAPTELAGAAFLQIQKDSGDDDRFLYLPELKRARRISGSLRSNSFMGTDLSYADLDRRDLREGAAARKADESIGRWSCFVLEVAPRDASPYSQIRLWIRKDNYLPLKMQMYDRRGELLKRFEAQEVRRVSGQWFVSKSRMVNVQENHSTELALDKIEVVSSVPESDFTVGALEKP